MGFNFPVWVSTTPMYLHSLHFTVWVHSLLGDLSALRILSPPPYTYIPCILCVGPILYIGPHHQYSLHFPALAPYTTTICLNSLCFLHGSSPLHWSLSPIFPVFPCVGSIPCMVTIFALRTLSPPPYTYIPCILCMGPHHQYSLCFPVWAPFPAWLPFCTKDTVLTTIYLHSLHSNFPQIAVSNPTALEIIFCLRLFLTFKKAWVSCFETT